MAASEKQNESRASAENEPRARPSGLVAATRLAAIFLTTVGYFACFLVARLFTGGAQGRLAAGARWSHRWSRRVLQLMGVSVRVEGELPPAGCLIAPNHFTWLDVIVLMAAAPMFFVSHAGVANWPVVGFFTRGIGTVFIRNTQGSRSLLAAAEAVRRRLSAGISVVIFLEGGTRGGLSILPFKPSLVQTAIDAAARIVPAAIHWRVERPGMSVEDDIGYFRDEHKFAVQAWRLLGLGHARSELKFGEPIDATGRERKELAGAVEAEVRRLYEEPVREWRE
jgi:1-acyl-sn-glycerol-3-phosphate acyltransferase